VTGPADLPLDDLDEAVLERLAAVHGLLDPPPADLDERVLFAVALDDLDTDLAAEVARLREDHLVGSVRGGERTRTITFDADSRTIMITLVDRSDGLLRIDGWLAPSAELRIELRFPAPERARTVTSDDAGRFVFDGVPHGLAQLLVHTPERTPGGAAPPPVVTPSLTL
jgi:hypothetical protein